MSDQVLHSILFPALIAAIGFLLKSAYELYLGNRQKKIELLENKLKLFYWPILIRLEKDNAIWGSILSKREDPNTLQFKIADNVEKQHVLKNHQEILDIISNNIYLAEPDKKLSVSINKYIKNVTIYKALRESGDEKTFPLDLGAEWPQDLFTLINERTEIYQTQLNKILSLKNLL